MTTDPRPYDRRDRTVFHKAVFPADSAERKTYPVYSGLLAYFPSALAEIARHSFVGNEKHNPGLPLHHDRAKSDDEADALVRHLMEGDYAGMAWRALSLFQKHLEANGAPIAPAARNATIVADHATAPELPPEVEARAYADTDDNVGDLRAWTADGSRD